MVQSLDQVNDFVNFGFSVGMSAAIKEAYGKKYLPNPSVGCALLDSSNKVLLQTHHKGKNTDHAEIAMLNIIKQQNIYTNDKSLYITLEPCLHEDTSPSCAKILAKTNIFNNIVIGDIDPDLRTNGKGYELLMKTTNITLENGSTSFVDPSYMSIKKNLNQKNKVPYVISKIALSQDSYVYSKMGPQYITSNHSRKLGHYLRGVVEGIIVGKNTLIVDDPKLTIRYGISAEEPRKFVLWGNDKSSLTDYLDKYIQFEFITSFEHENNRVHNIGEYTVQNTLEYLYSNNIYSILVEGGPETWRSFIPHSEKIFVFQSNKILNDGIKFNVKKEISHYASIYQENNISEDTLSIYNRTTD